MQNSILIFTGNTTNRLQYTCELVFKQHLGLNYTFTSDATEFIAYSGAKLIYSDKALCEGLAILPHPLLFETKIAKQQINTTNFKDITVPFANKDTLFGFDVFAAIFYLVSRYEEYLPFEANQYGQFKAKDSLGFKLGFLHKPVVDIWIGYLKNELANRFPFLQFKQKKFTATFTYDIDVAYAYKGRSLFVTIGRLIQEFITGNFAKVKERLLCVFLNKKDPFDTYAHILEQQQLRNHNLLFFFLLGESNKYNRNLPPKGKTMVELFKKISAFSPIGIHPSYYANLNFSQLQQEKQQLENIAKKKIISSRQHYLRLNFPNTYCNLLEAGLTDDYTLGFAELPGFRAGTCIPFAFYNLQKNEITSLLLHPHTFMEGTFIEDLKLPPAETKQQMLQLLQEVKNVNGAFISIWHNHSLCNKNEWQGMLEIHDRIAANAAVSD